MGRSRILLRLLRLLAVLFLLTLRNLVHRRRFYPAGGARFGANHEPLFAVCRRLTHGCKHSPFFRFLDPRRILILLSVKISILFFYRKSGRKSYHWRRRASVRAGAPAPAHCLCPTLAGPSAWCFNSSQRLTVFNKRLPE